MPPGRTRGAWIRQAHHKKSVKVAIPGEYKMMTNSTSSPDWGYLKSKTRANRKKNKVKFYIRNSFIKGIKKGVLS